MSRRLFGTDGIRGQANTQPMTAETAMKVGMAAGRLFSKGEHRHRVVIGKDTRLSCYTIESALQAGFTSVGMDVFLLGPVPTPAVAMLTRSLRADLGVMISASHNPFQDNGIKVFDNDGYKLSDEYEDRIEACVNGDTAALLAAPEKMGRAKRIEGMFDRYIEYAKRTLDRNIRLDGLKVVIDCANGRVRAGRRGRRYRYHRPGRRPVLRRRPGRLRDDRHAAGSQPERPRGRADLSGGRRRYR